MSATSEIIIFGSVILIFYKWRKLLNSHNVQLPVSNQSPKKNIKNFEGKEERKVDNRGVHKRDHLSLSLRLL
jgi:hypothetical protein